MIQLVEHLPGLGKSGHECLLFDLKCSKHIYKSSPVSYNFYKGNYAKICKMMSDTNWDSLLDCDIKEANTIFSNILEIATKELIPLKSNTARTKIYLWIVEL